MSLSEPASRAVPSGTSTSPPPSERSDCQAVVALLLSRVPFAAAVITAEGRIEVLNRAMAEAFATPVAALVGSSVIERHPSERARSTARAELARLASGAQPYARIRLDTKEISVLHVEPVAGAPGFFLVTAARELENTEETAVFEVSTAPGDHGHVLRRAVGGVWFDVAAGTRCVDLVCGRSQVCGECPAKALSAEMPIASHATASPGAAGDCLVVTARRTGPDRATVTAIRIDEATRAKLAEARLDAAAAAAGLSTREKQVLRSLLRGRDLAEIADELGISHRTVRFHQYNLLEKLGVESRADLPRLLL